MRTPLVVGNWKMYKTPSETEALLSELIPPLGQLAAQGQLDVALAPSFTSLPLAARALAGSGISLAAQDCHWTEEGPYTGEVSARMLAEVGCRYVIVGHSERREHFAETSRLINLKAKIALFWGLTPIICVGEKRDERAAGRTNRIVEDDLKNCLADLKLDKAQRIIVAYEPVWAIGTGLTASPDDVDEVHHVIRAELLSTYGAERGSALRIIYGGSVNAKNVADMLALESVDGVLVGGASLTAAAFLPLVERVKSGMPMHS
jgi:triosephosphate isomerase